MTVREAERQMFAWCEMEVSQRQRVAQVEVELTTGEGILRAKINSETVQTWL